ncbi:Lrp/AsnC family transcriptional regulator [Actinoalloteichus spitiensis]|uniref:Lrp/AsnC family transcriptional regulator n=1 Tax=Actinoalloteichus spitiensis TaxID=252394 RepID=UPI00037E0F84|nr:Lrp/AsnC family transcriptional regulator [Actinoalloteichus spitiensis]
MDRTDRAIIDHLRRDGRLANTEIADRVGLTPSPCLRRIRRLEDEGVILGYHARIAPHALDRAFEVLVDLELTDQARATLERFEAALVSFDEVVEARRMFGAPDYHAVVAVADLATYERFLTQRLMAVPGLSKLQSRFPMKTIKDDVPGGRGGTGAAST